MIRKTLLLCTGIFFFSTILSTENSSDTAIKALNLQMQTHPLRIELMAITKQLAALPKDRLDKKKEKAFKIHQEDITNALNEIVEWCRNILALNPQPGQSLTDAEKRLERAKEELNHLKKSIKNTLECIKQISSN